MPKKQPPLKKQPLRSTADTEPVSDAELSARDLTIQPATKRFYVVVALFGIWLVFLIYLASLTWSGK